MPVVASQQVGRNHPRPCGSGKDYKRCHGGCAIGYSLSTINRPLGRRWYSRSLAQSPCFERPREC
ncbi:MAG: SEC-C domain-containing protein [Acidobacteriia bacterium]|nr:SEC-C domain-containing protein [Terriglobia bacterium]